VRKKYFKYQKHLQLCPGLAGYAHALWFCSGVPHFLHIFWVCSAVSCLWLWFT